MANIVKIINSQIDLPVFLRCSKEKGRTPLLRVHPKEHIHINICLLQIGVAVVGG